MRLKIENSFYKFYPISKHELDLLKNRGFSVEPYRDYFTFPILKSLNKYSIENLPYSNTAAIATYCGRAEDVLLQNKLVLDLSLQILKPLSLIVSRLDYSVLDFFMFNGLPQCGAFMKNGKRLKSMSGYWRLQSSGAVIGEAVEYYD